MPDKINYLETAKKAAEIGAKTALKYFQTTLDVMTKEDKSPVTIADRNTEKEIMNFILSQDKNAKFVGEESGGNVNEDEFWIIDPIDGTKSFIRGLSHWCVMVAFVRNGNPIASVCYFPVLGFFYTAEKDKGSFLNGNKIHVSSIDNIKYSYLGFSNPKSYEEKERLLNLINLADNSRSPEATFSTCLVSEGKFDICVDNRAKDWDCVPVKLLIEEAGGKLTNMKGEDWNFGDVGYIATNKILHDKVMEIFRNK